MDHRLGADIRSLSHQLDLQFQVYAKLCGYLAAGQIEQGLDIARRRMVDVQKEVGVLLADLRAADLLALQPGVCGVYLFKPSFLK